MEFNDMVKSVRSRNNRITKTDRAHFEVGQWYASYATNDSEPEIYDYGFGYVVNIRITDRSGDYITCEDEVYGESYKRKVKNTVINGEIVETFKIKELDNATFYSSIQNI